MTDTVREEFYETLLDSQDANNINAILEEYNISKEDLDQIINFYRCEISYRVITKRFNISRVALYDMLKRVGAIEERKQGKLNKYRERIEKEDPETLKAVVKAYKSGMVMTDISKRFNITYDYMKAILVNAGIDMNSVRTVENEQMLNAIIEAHNRGMTEEEISERFGISKMIVVNTFKKLNFYYKVELKKDEGIDRKKNVGARVITEEMIEAVREAYEKKIPSIEIRKTFKISHGTYYNILAELGLQKKQRVQAILKSKSEIRKIIRFYKSGKSIDEVAEKFNIPKSFVREILRKNGVEVKRGATSKNRKKYKIEEIILAYQNGMKWDDMSEKFGVSKSWIQQLFRMHGVELRCEHLRDITDNNEIQEIICLYHSGWGIKRLANKFSTTELQIKNILKSYGINERTHPRSVLALPEPEKRKKIEEIIIAYKSKMSMKVICEKFSVSSRTVIKIVKDNGVELRGNIRKKN